MEGEFISNAHPSGTDPDATTSTPLSPAKDGPEQVGSGAFVHFDLDGRRAEYENSLQIVCGVSAAMTFLPGVGPAGLVIVAMVSALLFLAGVLQLRRGYVVEGRLTLVAALLNPLIGLAAYWAWLLIFGP